jgi:hypothetical protein
MTHTCDLCCDHCGGTAFSHFFGPDRRGQRRWQNRCQDCGRASEYVPTRGEIEDQCRELRGLQTLVALDDEQEKLWRRSMVAHDEDDEGDENDTNAECEIWNAE